MVNKRFKYYQDQSFYTESSHTSRFYFIGKLFSFLLTPDLKELLQVEGHGIEFLLCCASSDRDYS